MILGDLCVVRLGDCLTTYKKPWTWQPAVYVREGEHVVVIEQTEDYVMLLTRFGTLYIANNGYNASKLALLC